MSMRSTRIPRIVLLLLGSAVVSPTAVRAASLGAPAETLTVADCVRLARHAAPELVAARWEAVSAARDSAATAANRFPDFSLDAGATVAPRGFYDPVVTNLGDYALTAGLAVPLADGGRRRRDRRRAGLEAEAARERQALARRDGGLLAASLALRLERLQDQGRDEERAVHWLLGLQSLVRSGVASGVRSSTDSLRVSLERDGAIGDLEQTRVEAEATSLALLAAMGRATDTTLVIAPAPGGADDGPAPSDSLALAATRTAMPEVTLAASEEALRRVDLSDARHGAATSVDLALDAGFKGADLTAVVPEGLRASDPGANFGDRVRQDLGASAAVRVHFPLFDRSRAPRTAARAAGLEAATVRRRATELEQARRDRELLARWRSAADRLRLAAAAVDRADRNLILVKSLYAAGATTLLDLLDARGAQRDARARLREAREETRWASFRVEDRK